MATKFMETPDATQATQFWSTVVGSVTYDTTAGVKKSGLASWKCDSGAGNAAAYTALLMSTPRRLSAYFCLTGLPTTTACIIKLCGLEVRVTNTGVLQLWYASQIGSDGSTLSIGTVYRLCVTVSSISVTDAALFVDGDPDITGSVTTSWSGNNPMIGWYTAPGASKVLNFQHVYIDDSTSLTDVGDMRVTAKLPATVNNDNYDTTIGTGAVNERPVSEDNYKYQAAKAAVLQDYTLQTAAVGDVDLTATGITLVARDAWMWAAASKADTIYIVDNGDSTTSFATDWPARLHNKIVDSATYPSNAAGIGQKSSGAAPDDYLYECGTLIAYTVAGGTTFPRTASRTGTISTSVARTVIHARGPTRSGSITASVARAGIFGRTASRTGTIGVSVAAAHILPRAVTRIGDIAAIVARTGVFGRAVSRTGSVGAAVTRIGTFGRTLSRTGAITATLGAIKTVPRSASFTGSIVATVARVGTFGRALSRTGSITATVARGLVAPRALSRTGSVSASVVRGQVLGRVQSFTGSVSAVVDQALLHNRALSNTLAAVVATLSRAGSIYNRALSRVGSVLPAVATEEIEGAPPSVVNVVWRRTMDIIRRAREGLEGN